MWIPRTISISPTKYRTYIKYLFKLFNLALRTTNKSKRKKKMMFQKYISKITNTIGTVNYLQQKSKKSPPNSHSRRSSKQLLFDDGYDVAEVDPSTINKMDIDCSINGSRKNSLLDEFPPSTQIILSAAIAKLRNTLLFYPLVHWKVAFFVLYIVS